MFALTWLSLMAADYRALMCNIPPTDRQTVILGRDTGYIRLGLRCSSYIHGALQNKDTRRAARGSLHQPAGEHHPEPGPGHPDGNRQLLQQV